MNVEEEAVTPEGTYLLPDRQRAEELVDNMLKRANRLEIDPVYFYQAMFNRLTQDMAAQINIPRGVDQATVATGIGQISLRVLKTLMKEELDVPKALCVLFNVGSLITEQTIQGRNASSTKLA